MNGNVGDDALRKRVDPGAPEDRLGSEMHAFMAELYPICSSITGEGAREVLRHLGKHVPLVAHEVATGTRAFDWTVPREWNIRDACVKDGQGRRVVDLADSNLHVVSYSVPVHRSMSLAELREHLHTLPDHPDWIPYRTSYYAERWGFCLEHRRFLELEEGTYEVCIDSTLEDGYLTYGECFLPGLSDEEVLISTHICHPSMCNDNLSGIVVATFLAKLLATLERRWSYRFVFVPGTIGAVTWLSRNEATAGRIRHGLVLANLGDPGGFTYKKSRRGDAEIDKTVAAVIDGGDPPPVVEEFTPYGYDERQYCSPGFDLPVGSLCRTMYGRYPQYHTSADDLSFVRPEALGGSLAVLLDVIDVLERNRTYRNVSPMCEPQLGRRGLYRSMGGEAGQEEELAILWVLNLSDGRHALLDIANRSHFGFGVIAGAAQALERHGLLEEVDPEVEDATDPGGSHAAGVGTGVTRDRSGPSDVRTSP